MVRPLELERSLPQRPRWPLDDSEMAQDESKGFAARGLVAGTQRTRQWTPQADYGAMRRFDSVRCRSCLAHVSRWRN
jgi:hypothetical protein